MKEDMREFGHHHFHMAAHGPWHGGHRGWRGRHGSGRGPGGPGGPGRGGWGAWGGARGPWGLEDNEQWGGPGGHHRDRMERGLLRYVILDVLRDGPKHGYEIIKTLEERTGGRYAPSPGTLYPTLQYLEDLGLVSSDQEESRRVYHLTDAGRAELDERSRVIEGFWSRFRDRGRTQHGPARQETKFLEDSINDLFRTVLSGLRTADLDTVRRMRQALEKCQNEVRDILAEQAARASDRPSPADNEEGLGEVSL